jgi:hypothetical protein
MLHSIENISKSMIYLKDPLFLLTARRAKEVVEAELTGRELSKMPKPTVSYG